MPSPRLVRHALEGCLQTPEHMLFAVAENVRGGEQRIKYHDHKIAPGKSGQRVGGEGFTKNQG
jgi:hypothetical protein